MAGTASVDAMLSDAISKMDALTKRMDALETGEGHKNPIAKGDDDDDAKKRDSAKSASKSDDDDDDKKDDATTPSNKIHDDEDPDKKDDAGVATPPLKAKHDDGELEIKHEPEEKEKDMKKGDKKKKKDSAKTDAKMVFGKKVDDDDDDKKDDAAKKDDDDDDKKDDSARADAITDMRRQLTEQAATIARLTAMMKPKSDEEHAAFADAQARADTVFSGFGTRAPRPLEGESLTDYRKRLATKLKGHSTTWKGVKLSRLDDDTFNIAESAIYADATTAAANPVDLEAGELRPVTKIDPTTGVRQIVFYGKESFVKGMGRPGRRVAAFRTMASQ